ncbi:MAG: hypothetical protein IJR47_00380 [Clostridia bacterium]|nr:hypothetical protein [Clostridia bacterium]
MSKHYWAIMVLCAAAVALFFGKTAQTAIAGIEAGKNAVNLVLGVVGGFAFWMGLINIAKKSGLVSKLARLLKPVILFLYPEAKENPKAAENLCLNMSCNMLGLGNGATPAGLEAVKHLQERNKNKKTATKAMCALLVVNASSVQLLPTSIITLRASMGSANPNSVIPAVLIATGVSTLCGIAAVKVCEKIW